MFFMTYSHVWRQSILIIYDKKRSFPVAKVSWYESGAS